MTADITIPPEALEAFLREVEAHHENISGEAARAACLAMLKAWPGIRNEPNDFERWKISGSFIILPLPQEASDE